MTQIELIFADLFEENLTREMSPTDFADLRGIIVWWNADNTDWADFRRFVWREFGVGNVSRRFRRCFWTV